ICGPRAEFRTTLYCGDRLLEPGLRNYRIVECSNCHLRFLNPRPINRLTYPENRSSTESETPYHPFLSLQTDLSITDRLYLIARQFTIRWKRNKVREWIPPGGRVIDIGCGTGEFLNAIKNDYQVAGVEPEEQAANFGRDHYRIPIYTGTIDDLPQDLAADLITFWHSLEHIPQPVEDLIKALKHLKPQGKVLIAAPNCSSWDARIYQANWIAWDAPRHLYHFTPVTLSQLAQNAGLSVVANGSLPLDHIYNILMSEKLAAASLGKSFSFISLFRAPLVAILSPLYGMLTGNHSGMWYLLQPTP
ncbi:MAG: class I SAM-dependent methyltransferase, partial [bacterium]